MTMTVPPRPAWERTHGDEDVPRVLDAPLWLLAGVEDEDEARFEPHIWRGTD